MAKRKIVFLLDNDCGRLCGTRPEEADRVLQCVYEHYRADIEWLFDWYFTQVADVHTPAKGKDAERQKAQRRWLALSAIAACGYPRNPCCPKQEEHTALGFLDLCRACDNSFYAFRGGDNARKSVRRYVRQEIERLLVSERLERSAREPLAKALGVEISADVLEGCTLYLIGRTIGYRRTTEAALLSSDLADLVLRTLRAAGVDDVAEVSAFGPGGWILNDVVPHVLRHKQGIQQTAPALNGWPRFSKDWQQLGSDLSRSHPNKFRKRSEGRRR